MSINFRAFDLLFVGVKCAVVIDELREEGQGNGLGKGMHVHIRQQLMEPEVIAGVRLHHFDGAGSFKYLD